MGKIKEIVCLVTSPKIVKLLIKMIGKIIFILTFLLPLVFSQNPQICEGVPEFRFVASQQDCYIYYQCIEGISYRLQCPRGTYFSTERQTCVPYQESDCPLLVSTTSPTPPQELPTCADIPEFGYIPSLQACDYYYQCIEDIQYLLKCPRGLYFSFAQQTCVSPSDSDCPLINTTPVPPTTTAPPNELPTCACCANNSIGCICIYCCCNNTSCCSTQACCRAPAISTCTRCGC